MPASDDLQDQWQMEQRNRPFLPQRRDRPAFLGRAKLFSPRRETWVACTTVRESAPGASHGERQK